MNNRVAEFSKVSFEQFQKDFNETFIADTYSYDDVKKIYDGIMLPKRATKGSAGYDFKSPISFSLRPSETIKIPTGIRVSMYNDYVMMIFPRSSLGFKYRVQLDNTVGIIDSDYFFSDNQGHIFIKLTNDSKSDKVLEVKIGSGIAQGIFLPFGITMNDDCNEVRNGGFGSTDKK